MASESERRGDVRAPIELKIEYKSLNTFFADYTANLSTRGTFIRTPNPLPVGTEFNFKLVVPRMDNAIELRGVVRWIRGKDQGTQGEESGMGIEFQFESDAQFETLRQAAESLMKANLGETITGQLLSKRAAKSDGEGDPK